MENRDLRTEAFIASAGPTYAHRFLDATKKFASRPALRWNEAGAWREMSYLELEQEVLACAVALQAGGVRLGDRVAIWLDNSSPWIICDLAAQLLGAVTTTVYHTLNPSQANRLLQDAEPKAILSNQQRLEGLRAVGGLTDDSMLALSVDDGALGQSFRTLLREAAQQLSVQPEISAGLRTPVAQSADLSALFYTSGTTGEPKGVMLTHGNLLFNVEGTIAQMMPRGGHTVLLHLPLAHVMARNTTVPATFLTGGILAIAEPEREQLPQNLLELAPTAFPTVPYLLDKFRERALEAIFAKPWASRRLALWALDYCRVRRLAAIGNGGTLGAERLGVVGRLLDRLILKKIRAKLGGNLEFIVIGGANSNRKSVEFFWGIGIPVFEGYGATEVTNTAAITWAGGMKLGTVGQHVPGIELKLAPDGEILVRGPIVMQGYWRRAAATDEVIDEAGWYHTGDIGELDDAGYLSIIDRKREILVLATGKNISPQLIENTLKRSQLVLNACAIGHHRRYTAALIVPDLSAVGQRLGLEGAATINDPRVETLLRVALSREMKDLSHFERIKRFRLIEVPFTTEKGLLTPTLKLLRRRIAEQYADEIEDLYADSPRQAIDVD